jgi:ankyrin repeat protein
MASAPYTEDEYARDFKFSESSLTKNSTIFLFEAICAEDVLSIAKLLVSPTINVNERFSYRDHETTLLHVAAKTGNALITELLIMAGANLDAVDQEGHKASKLITTRAVSTLATEAITAADTSSFSPLYQAAERGDLLAVTHLLRAGTKCDGYDERAPLYIATIKRHALIVELLLAQGVFVDPVDRASGFTPFDFASRNNTEIAPLLRRAGAKVRRSESVKPITTPPLRLLVMTNNLSRIEQLLRENAIDPDLAEIDGLYPLHIAVMQNNVPMIKLLLKFDANVDVTNFELMTPLHLAIDLKCSSEVIEALFTAKALPSLTKLDIYLSTPLHVAVIRNYAAAVRLLLEHGADPKIPFGDPEHPEWTPLFLATQAPAINQTIIDLLKTHGAATPDSATSAMLRCAIERPPISRSATAVNLWAGAGAGAGAGAHASPTRAATSAMLRL